MKRITGDFTITGSDDDYAGFAFAYQNRGQMYLFGWKEQDQGSSVKGMFLSIIDTGSSTIDPERLDFSSSTSISSSVRTILCENSLSWKRNTDYDFVLDFYNGSFEITIYEDGSELESWSVVDSTFTGGDFGFFNLSQAGVTYGNLNVTTIPAPGAIILGGIGAGFVGWLRRRMSI
jgi:hypothetical protein